MNVPPVTKPAPAVIVIVLSLILLVRATVPVAFGRVIVLSLPVASAAVRSIS